MDERSQKLTNTRKRGEGLLERPNFDTRTSHRQEKMIFSVAVLNGRLDCKFAKERVVITTT